MAIKDGDGVECIYIADDDISTDVPGTSGSAPHRDVGASTSNYHSLGREPGKRFNCNPMRWTFPYLIEPVMFLLFLTQGGLTLLTPLFIYLRVQSTLHGDVSLNGLYGECSANRSTLAPSYSSSKLVETSAWLLACQMSVLIPPLLISKAIFNYTVVVGRKFGLLLPFIGLSVSAICFIITDQYHVSLLLLVFGHLIQGLLGGTSVAIASAYAYLTDAVVPEKRIFRYGIASSMAFLALTLSSFFTGRIIDSFGYITTLTLVIVLALLACIYVICVLPESLPYGHADRVDPVDFQFHFYWKKLCDGLDNGLRLIQKKRETGRNQLIILAIISFVDACLLSNSVDINILYLVGHPLCLNTIDVGNAITVQVILIITGPLVGARLFYRSYPGALAGLVVCFLTGLGLILQGVARMNAVVLLAFFLQFLRSMNGDVSRRNILRLLDRTDEGTACIALTSLVEVGQCSSILINLLLFCALAGSFPGTLFIFQGIVYLVGIVLYGILYFLDYKANDGGVTS